MIVVEGPDNTLRVVSQPDHASVSGDLALRWRRPAAIPEAMWPRFVDAVSRHDAGWHEAEEMPAVDERGRPRHFKNVATIEHTAIWERSVEALRSNDVYGGLLVALHARWLYTHVATEAEQELAAAQDFLGRLDRTVDALLEQLKRGDAAMREAIEPQSLEVARRLFGLLDAMSLMLAGGLAVRGFDEPVAFEKQHAALQMRWGSEPAGLRVNPWPFESEPFTVHLRAKQIPDRRYRSAVDLAAALRRADVFHMSHEIHPGTRELTG